MKCIKLEYDGVFKLVPVSGSEDELNRLTKQGYKPVMKDGSVEIVDMTKSQKLNYIADPVVNEALSKLNNSNTVSKEVVDKSK